MVQLILDTDGINIALPESQRMGYTVEKVPLSVDVQMVTGRIVRELQGFVWKISYNYGYLNDDEKKKVISACEKGQRAPIRCSFLTQESGGELQNGLFFVTSFSRPKFMWSRFVNENGVSSPVPMWADFSLELREVEPSD